MRDYPVLIVAHSRVDTLKCVLIELNKVKPATLYVFADGPRNDTEVAKCQAVRKLIDDCIKWDCDLHKFYSENNYGCGKGVSSAISWALQKEEGLIIIEDDCVPAVSFFPFCNTLLEKYKDDERIWYISGTNFLEPYHKSETSYIFSKYGNIWGCDTWKRCWHKYDYRMESFSEFQRLKTLYTQFPKREADYFMKLYANDIKRIDSKNSWALQFDYLVNSNGGLSIVPAGNLITNIGHDGSHTSKRSSVFHDKPVAESFSVQSSPQFVTPDYAYDRQYFKAFWRKKESVFPRRNCGRKIRIGSCGK